MTQTPPPSPTHMDNADLWLVRRSIERPVYKEKLHILDFLFRGLFGSNLIQVIALTDLLLCVGCSLILGLLITLAYLYRTRCTRSFVVTLALLPTVVCVVIMMVNGNVGTGVAVAGTFSLVYLRSAPGTAREICAVFLVISAGRIAEMGYLAYALVFTVILCVTFALYNCLGLGAGKKATAYKIFQITIPEDLDYTGEFDEVFAQYVSSCELAGVKTTKELRRQHHLDGHRRRPERRPRYVRRV